MSQSRIALFIRPTRIVLAIAALLLPARSAQAVKLIAMNIATNFTNSTIPAGEQIVTFGIQITAAELAGAGTDPVLSVHNLTFAGNGIVPINGFNSASNQVDVQNIQTRIIDNIAENNGVPAVQTDLSSAQRQGLYADSWWYNSPTGVLQGVNDGAGDIGNLTDITWQLGPVGFVGSKAYTWTPNGMAGVQAGATALDALASPSGRNATTGQYMIYSGTYGPSGGHAFDPSQFVNGILTVPIAQIATRGDIWLPGTDSNAAGVLPGAVGSGTYIELAGDGVSNGPTGNGTYNVLGGFPFYSPYSFYDFRNPRNLVLPEPGSIILAGLGAAVILLSRKRLKHKATVATTARQEIR